ncbi:MAG: sugar transferase [Muribaculaceae bacterium]|nr:sugar transferase [Muribaculaceae bacterium]
MYRKFFKRAIDVSASAGVLIVFSPVLLAVSLWLWMVNGKAGVFFTQPRPGKDGKVFKVLKFKTMNDKRDATGNLLPDKDRTTRPGRLLRATSIDELPQLINVLKGDMSLIGPRPLLVDYLPLYSERQARRHEVKPGITGWAQCHGRNSISWAEKFELDVWYVDNISFKTDCSIVWTTLKKVIKKDGVNSSETVTMVRFDGTN